MIKKSTDFETILNYSCCTPTQYKHVIQGTAPRVIRNTSDVAMDTHHKGAMGDEILL